MKAYINGIGAVAPEVTLDTDQFLDHVKSNVSNRLQIVDINYRDFINPKVLRRMSKIVRMSIVSANIALAESGIEKPDAIITGTGMGCQADTEKFLNAMLNNNESMLNPTAFIQSTHNTMGAQIALMNNNKNYNLSYVHRTFSFESALLDSLMLLNENEASNILLGGIDEITEESWLIKTRIGYYKSEPINNLKLIDDKQTGALAGESAAFFVLSSEKTEKTYAEIVDVSTFYKPESQDITQDNINEFLLKNGLNPELINMVIMGYNGDPEYDDIYKQLERSIFKSNSIGYYKHLCGEHDTSSAFALWIAARILKSAHIPPIVIKENKGIEKPQYIIIYNQFRNTNHSLILLRKAE